MSDIQPTAPLIVIAFTEDPDNADNDDIEDMLDEMFNPETEVVEITNPTKEERKTYFKPVFEIASTPPGNIFIALKNSVLSLSKCCYWLLGIWATTFIKNISPVCVINFTFAISSYILISWTASVYWKKSVQKCHNRLLSDNFLRIF